MSKIQEYVSAVSAFSSEAFNNPASNIIGPPNVYPSHQSDYNTWSPQNTNSDEFIEIKFSKWIIPTDIEIYET
jgi:hypothetical protein